jgi:hypothetical protein
MDKSDPLHVALNTGHTMCMILQGTVCAEGPEM